MSFFRLPQVDFSQHFIDAANTMKAAGTLPFSIQKQGGIMAHCVAQVPADIDRSKVSFSQGDACNLRGELGHDNFDLCISYFIHFSQRELTFHACMPLLLLINHY